VAITHANVINSKGFKNVTPKQGVVYADKGYCDNNVQRIAKANNLHLCAIKKNNMRGKNFDLDKFYCALRPPYERAFSNCYKRTRYRVVAKNQFHVFMQTIAFNLKRLFVLAEENTKLATQSLNPQLLAA
jgi:hypothetical protein